MRLEVRTLVERASRWLVSNLRPPIVAEEVVDLYEVVVQRVTSQLPELLVGRELDAFEKRNAELVAADVPEDLARRIAVLPPSYAVLGVVETAHRAGLDPLEVARVHFVLGERLCLPALAVRILGLPRTDRWQTMARAALRDELHAVHAQLTAQVLDRTPAEAPEEERVAAWEQQEATAVERALVTLNEVCSDDRVDLARLSVGLRVVRTLLVAP
jgi:glutamate dehydrogenase